jgi:hypothetical protein
MHHRRVAGGAAAGRGLSAPLIALHKPTRRGGAVPAGVLFPSSLSLLPLPCPLHCAADGGMGSRQVWNPDASEDVGEPGRKDEQDDGIGLHDTLCGQSLEQDDCPEVPAFSGEDYFDDKALGCCNSKEQQLVWSKWNELKQRVAKLEGEVHYLRDVDKNVYIKQAYKDKATRTVLHGGHVNARPTHRAKPYFHGMRLLERRREASKNMRGHPDVADAAVPIQQLRGLPRKKGKPAAKLAFTPVNYFKSGADQAARDQFLAHGYHDYLLHHHNIAGNKAVDGQVCSLLGSHSMLRVGAYAVCVRARVGACLHACVRVHVFVRVCGFL